MSNNSVQQNGGGGFTDSILTIVGLIVLALVFKYVWHGIVWAFNMYVTLLKVK